MKWAGAAVFAACLGSSAATALADTVYLQNGDRLTGRIVHLSPDSLTLETTWAGEMTILRYEVRAIETDKPVTILREHHQRSEWVMLAPGENGWATVTPAQPGDIEAPIATESGADTPPPPPVKKVAASLDVSLPSIRYLNPKPEESGEGVSYDGRVTLSGALTQGNGDAERFYSESDLEARALEWRSSLGLKLRRERDHGNVVASNWLASGNYDRFLDGSRKFGYLRASFESDRFRDIDVRSTAGAGLGLQLLDNERTKWSARGGFDIIDARHRIERDEAWPALGWGTNVTHRLSTFPAELFHDETGFLNLQDESQVSLRSRSGIRVPVGGGVTASLQLNLDWESVPSTGRRAVDTGWLVGLGYAW